MSIIHTGYRYYCPRCRRILSNMDGHSLVCQNCGPLMLPGDYEKDLLTITFWERDSCNSYKICKRVAVFSRDLEKFEKNMPILDDPNFLFWSPGYPWSGNHPTNYFAVYRKRCEGALHAGYLLRGHYPYHIAACLNKTEWTLEYLAIRLDNGMRVRITELFPDKFADCGVIVNIQGKRTEKQELLLNLEGAQCPDVILQAFSNGKKAFLSDIHFLYKYAGLGSIPDVIDSFTAKNTMYLVTEYHFTLPLAVYAKLHDAYPIALMPVLLPLLQDWHAINQQGDFLNNWHFGDVEVQMDSSIPLARLYSKGTLNLHSAQLEPEAPLLLLNNSPAEEVRCAAGMLHEYVFTGRDDLTGDSMSIQNYLSRIRYPIPLETLDRCLSLLKRCESRTNLPCSSVGELLFAIQGLLPPLSPCAPKDIVDQSKPAAKLVFPAPGPFHFVEEIF